MRRRERERRRGDRRGRGRGGGGRGGGEGATQKLMLQQSSRWIVPLTTTSLAVDFACGNCVRNTDRSMYVTPGAAAATPYLCDPADTARATASHEHGHIPAAVVGNGPRIRSSGNPTPAIVSSRAPLAAARRSTFSACSAAATTTPSYRTMSKRTSVACGTSATQSGSWAMLSTRTAKLVWSACHLERAVPYGSWASATQARTPSANRAWSSVDRVPGVRAMNVAVSGGTRLDTPRVPVGVADAAGVGLWVALGLGVGGRDGDWIRDWDADGDTVADGDGDMDGDADEDGDGERTADVGGGGDGESDSELEADANGGERGGGGWSSGGQNGGRWWWKGAGDCKGRRTRMQGGVYALFMAGLPGRVAFYLLRKCPLRRANPWVQVWVQDFCYHPSVWTYLVPLKVKIHKIAPWEQLPP